MKTLVVSCTRGDFLDTELYNSLLKYNVYTCANMARTDDPDTSYMKGNKFSLYIKTNNTSHLAKIYNEGKRVAIEDGYDTVIFAHDDVSIQDTFIKDKLTTAFESYSVVGLAGAVTIRPEKRPCLWHLMSNKDEWRGAVAHKAVQADREFFGWSQYGVIPDRVLVIDGLFIACNVKALKDAEVGFDEWIPHGGFHHYDMIFCLAANKAGLKIGVAPIWVVHNSPGLLKKDDAYHESENYFLKKSKVYL